MAKEKQNVEPYWGEKLLESYSLDATARTEERRMIMLCDTCVNAGTASYKYPCNCCDMIEGSSRCKYKKVRTHADRIRAMSDEELAKWLARTQYANMMEAAEIFGEQLPFEEETLKGSEQECLQWLKQPAEE